MHNIRLQHFRSYGDAFFELDPGANIIVGPNASGKTNLLEAVLMLARGSSYRVKDVDMIAFDHSWARLDTQTPTGERIIKLRHDTTPAKEFMIDGQRLSRLHMSKTIPTVLFEPDHLLLMSGSPDLRRGFLDELIEQLVPGFSATRRHYKRVLSHRNALLKRQPKDLREQLFVWNIRLSELGGQIAKQRSELVDRFNEAVSEVYAHIAGRDNHIALRYATRFTIPHYESQLLHKLESSLELDILRGFTAYGPHRDDIEVSIDGHLLQESASRGETRTIILVLKILELQLIEATRNERPLLLLDDVFSELDAHRRQALTSYVSSHQSFITTTDADVADGHFAAVAHTTIRL